MSKTFLAVNFGCRVNSAETNQWSQILVDQGYNPSKINPDIIFINTCSITKKGELESLGSVRHLRQIYPDAKIFVTGCANLDKVKDLSNISVFKNDQKEKILKELESSYSPKIKDKFSHTHRFLLKVQSGCSQFCSYCIVPFKRPKLFSLPISQAIKTVQKAITNGYQEVIITGVNIDQYQYDFSNLIKEILQKTDIKLISFGSIPLNCINQKFIDLFKNPEYQSRLSHFFHIPIQSGSDKILKLMHRPYSKKDILNKFNKLINFSLSSKGDTSAIAEERDFTFGTDIIVGFPTETDNDFQDTLNLCQKIGFSKIHCFKFSPRPDTLARTIFDQSPKIFKEVLKYRSQQVRNLL